MQFIKDFINTLRFNYRIKQLMKVNCHLEYDKVTLGGIDYIKRTILIEKNFDYAGFLLKHRLIIRNDVFPMDYVDSIMIVTKYGCYNLGRFEAGTYAKLLACQVESQLKSREKYEVQNN